MLLLRLRPQRQRRHQRLRLRLRANPELSLRLPRKMESSARQRPQLQPLRNRKLSPFHCLSSRQCRRPYRSLHSNQPRSLRRR